MDLLLKLNIFPPRLDADEDLLTSDSDGFRFVHDE